jgi:nucleoid-associated protein YgaU
MGNLEKLGILVIVILVVVVGVVAITPKSTVDERLMPEMAAVEPANAPEPLDEAAPPADPWPDATKQLPTLDPAVSDTRVVKAESDDTFAAIAQRELGTATRYEEIAKLNPTLSGARLKKGQEVRVPGAAPPTIAPAAPQVAPLSVPPAAEERVYTVKSGDSLWLIAKRELGSESHLAALRKANSDVLRGSDALKIGMKLKLPGAAANAADPVPAKPQEPAAVGAEREYTVKAGDSLWLIAKREMGSEAHLAALRKANAGLLKGGDALQVGMKLRIPAAGR